ncbi:MAG: hypothetical protein AAB389_03665 [Patescibacteria group bacterium]
MKNQKSYKSQSGYLAITMSIVVTFFLLVLAISLGSSNLFTRGNVTDFYSKQFSYFIARSCLNHALLQLADVSTYTGNETIYISDQTCTLLTITTDASNTIIRAEALVNSAATNLRLTVNTQTLSTVSLEEVASF